MPALIKAIYKDGVFEPLEPIQGLAEDQPVLLHISLDVPNRDETMEDGPAFWSDLEGDAEWETLMRDEHAIRVRGGLTPEEAEERVRQIFVNWTTTRLSSEQVLEIAMDDSFLEENQNL